MKAWWWWKPSETQTSHCRRRRSIHRLNQPTLSRTQFQKFTFWVQTKNHNKNGQTSVCVCVIKYLHGSAVGEAGVPAPWHSLVRREPPGPLAFKEEDGFGEGVSVVMVGRMGMAVKREAIVAGEEAEEEKKKQSSEGGHWWEVWGKG